jgi:hypothetical protein
MFDTLFGLGNMVALTGWALLLAVPRWRGIAQTVSGVIIPALLALAYTVLIEIWWSRSTGGFGSIGDVHALFGSTPILVAGWFHYLAFDLLVGAWISREAQRQGIAHLFIVPVLVLTFMLGPMGYLAFLGLRAAWRSGAKSQMPDRAGFWSRLALREPALVATGMLFFLAMVPTGLAYGSDDRLVAGVAGWLKPLKFELSLGLFALTLAWFMPLASEAFRRSWAGRYVVWGFAIPATLEILYIAWRASRAEASHFNVSTPAAAALYGLMGLGAVMLTATAPLLAWGIARHDAPPADPAYRLAVILGLVLTFVLGGVEGMVMAQHAGHNVGPIAAGDTGVPLFGWLRSAGDLRVAHFLGIHAQQVIPMSGALAAWLLPSRARGAVIAFAALYSLAVLAAFVEAQLGRPVLPM